MFREILKRCEAGERVALCTLVKTRGSTPQELGAKMLVCSDGLVLGTLGGGCVEAEVRSRADELLVEGRSDLMSFQLDHDYGWDDGLICGGRVEIYADVLCGTTALERFTPLIHAIEQRATCTFGFEYPSSDGSELFTEVLAPSPVLLIAGGGHIGLALATIASHLDFAIVVADDRKEYVAPDRFPVHTRLLPGSFAATLGQFPIDATTNIVIVTRGHKRDAHVLEAVIHSPACYIGMIGSKRKAHTILTALADKGVPSHVLARVHAPMGLEINAITVPEIAVSILAEIIAARRDREGRAAEPMWLPREQIIRMSHRVERGEG